MQLHGRADRIAGLALGHWRVRGKIVSEHENRIRTSIRTVQTGLTPERAIPIVPKLGEGWGLMRATIATACALVMCAGVSHAALISDDLSAPGDGLLTRDQSTRLDWLDVTATVGQSRSSVLAGPFAALGFRYATETEVLQLWQDAGAVGPWNNNVGSNYSIPNFRAANLLIDLMGCTSQLVGDPCDGANQNFHIGLFGSDPTDAALVDYFGPPDPLRAGAAAMWIDFGPTVDVLHRPDVGSYLVRPFRVPEPSALSIALLAIIMFFAGFTRVLLRVARAGARSRLRKGPSVLV
jgi:hypothetical protein